MEPNGKIELRKSTEDEVDIAVPLIYSSGPESFDFVFKNNKKLATDFLKYAFVRKGGEFSYQNHYSLYKGNVLVAVGSVFNAKQAAAFAFYDGMKIMRYYRLMCFPVIKNGLQIESIIQLPKRNEIAIAHLGVQPEFQGQGLGTELINRLMEKAIKKEGSQFVLDVSEENPRAKALYERLGFVSTKKVDSSLKNKYSYVPAMFRMKLLKNR